MLNDYKSSYKELLRRSEKPSIYLTRTRTLCIAIYKTINNLNLEFMKNLFKVLKTNRAQRYQFKLNLELSKSNQVSFGTKSLYIQDCKVWNYIPFPVKFK